MFRKAAKIVLSLFIFASLTVVPRTFAQMGMMGNYYNDDATSSSQTEQQNQLKLNTMVNGLLKAQHVSSVNQLDCQKIGNDQLEKLGDAWMDVVIPNASEHQAMDNMMGGNGSQNLTNAHIGMAENYLGCSNGTTNYSWAPMMFGVYNNANRNATGGGGYPMMGWGGYGYGSMMNGGFGWGFGIIAFLFWVVAFIDLILLGIFLWKRIKK